MQIESNALCVCVFIYMCDSGVYDKINGVFEKSKMRFN